VIDVKPYIPYDIVPSLYILPMATDDVGNALVHRSLSVPNWIVESDVPLNTVFFSEEVNQSLDLAFTRSAVKLQRISRSKDEILELIKQILRQDIRGAHQGRGDKMIAEKNEDYHFNLDFFSITFHATTSGTHVTSIIDQLI